MAPSNAPTPVVENAPPCEAWSECFRAFTLQHLVVVAACAAVMITVVVLGRRARRVDREHVVRRTWAWSVIAWQVPAQLWWVLPANFVLGDSLPLQICDVAAMLAPVALLTRKRWLISLLYFWGIGLSTQAFFTPILTEGHGHVKFWLFWVGHTQIVGSAVYAVCVMGFRPRGRDLLGSVGVGVAYIAALFVLDVILKVNYGYVGPSTPGARTLLDFLGPWPWRAVWLVGLAVVAQTLAYLPWAVFGRARSTPKAEPQPGPTRAEVE